MAVCTIVPSPVQRGLQTVCWYTNGLPEISLQTPLELLPAGSISCSRKSGGGDCGIGSGDDGVARRSERRLWLRQVALCFLHGGGSVMLRAATQRVEGSGAQGWGSVLVLKMFEWNEDEEVRESIWEALNENASKIVPYPNGSEDDTPCTFSELSKRQRHEQTKTNLSIEEQRKSGAKNDFPDPSLGSNSNFHTNEELSTPRFGMDTWPDLPSLNCAFGSERNHLDSMSSKFINDCLRSPNMETVTESMVTELYDAVLQNGNPSPKEACSLSAPDITKLNGKRDICVDEHEDKEGDSFLNCDWANIADFDRIFRNDDFIFGHEIISNADEIFSPSMDADSTTVPSFPMPDRPVTRDSSVEREFSTFQVDEQPRTERKPLEKDKVADNSVAGTKQASYQSQLNSESCGTDNRLSVKVDRQKKVSKSRKKMEVKSRTRTPQNLSSSCPSNMSGIQQFANIKVQTHLNPPSQSQPAALCQPREGGRPGYIGFSPGTSQHLLPAFEYPVHAFPMMPMPSPTHPERQQQAVTASHLSSKQTSNFQSKSQSMTPQEKIEKLRRLQQMQAMLAIQQQQQQFGQQSTSTEMSVSQTSAQMNQSHGAAACSEVHDEATKWLSSSELNMTLEGDEFQKIPILIDDSLGETMFYQLQDAIGKLDVGLRLCIRDSVFRLARSAMERHNASDRNSTNKSCRDEDEALVNEETNGQDRSMRLSAETGTNPIDRIVAHLFFHWPSEPDSRPAEDEMFSSPLTNNHVSKQSSANEGMSKEQMSWETQTSM